MLENFKKYKEENLLFSDDETILLAISGGIDSMVLCDLFLKSSYKFAIAHCNFQLRGEESFRDENFVTNYCNKNNITLHKIRFDTYKHMDIEGISLQMAARDLRYRWFEDLLQENNYKYLATGHHGDDSIETFLINIIRGTGIAGLHGIQHKINNIIHPLLFTNREEISAYAKKNNIEFVEDSTNSSTKYTRNKIRHELIPLIKEISPNFQRTILKEIERFKETEQVFRTVIDQAKQEIFAFENDRINISIEKIKNLNPQRIYLYEFLNEYNFNESTINSILESIYEKSSGKQFFSETHRIVKDREYLILTQNNIINNNEYHISDNLTSIKFPLSLEMEFLKDLSFIKIPKTKDIAMLDADKLEFPLILRKWKKGDYFYPYGLKGEKKISEFYKNLKYSIVDKENQWLLCSNDDIVWVIGQRIDDRYKITNKTKTIYRIELSE
ncbi:MAG: tRNA lysidine(34) synthetase TilS [Bacteroidales bacterium]|jgi:tRNA(Ile)-lysidine synthase|nr:tRNA lysidine(34) synthetase TilS [Bacteroidales bacterium]MDY0054027.1 tRNA lysidine(34) synthetase TilS [Bacteroidales bacterium]